MSMNLQSIYYIEDVFLRALKLLYPANLKELDFIRFYHNGNISCSSNQSTRLLSLSICNHFYIQRRNFRVRQLPRVIKSTTSDHKSQSFIVRFSSRLNEYFLDKKDSKARKLAQANVTWSVYESGIAKCSEVEQKTFTEGFIKALALWKTNKSDKTDSRPFRVYILLNLGAFALFAYWLLSKMSGTIQEVKSENTHVNFSDVRGMDDAKHEMKEIVEYMRDPKRFSKLGGRLPKGALLIGPPGTGKTLLARAIAGEAEVPFFRISGSEFDEVFVGMGARRVRELFDFAKRKAPCIIFIDEIDSVGSKRVANNLHPYANQTINQLLTEMDGFSPNEGVIVIGATNRLEDLDDAILRPGRFDLRITIMRPDLIGRKDILSFYLGKIVCATDVNIDILAKGTTGFTGADIESLVNHAALKAGLDDAKVVKMKHLEDSRDRILMGAARRSGRIPDEEVNRYTAYHEAGHALVAFFTKDAVPIHKVTIIPRGQSLGHTALLPDKEEYHLTRSQLFAQLDMMMGGRVAEELIFGSDRITTGAADDLKKATQLATKMVKSLGMSEKVGLRDYSLKDNEALISISDLSPETTSLIDQEINRILNDSYNRAKEILTKHKKEHKALAEALLERETLSSEEIKKLLSRRSIKIKS